METPENMGDSLGTKRTLAVLNEIFAHPHAILNRHEPPPLVLPRSRLFLLLAHLLARITIIHLLSLVPAFRFLISTVLDVFRGPSGDVVGLAFRCVVVNDWCRDAGRDNVPVLGLDEFADGGCKELTLL